MVAAPRYQGADPVDGDPGGELEHYPTLWDHLTGFFCPVAAPHFLSDAPHRISKRS